MTTDEKVLDNLKQPTLKSFNLVNGTYDMTISLLRRRLCIIVIVTTALLVSPLTTSNNTLAQSQSANMQQQQDQTKQLEQNQTDANIGTINQTLSSSNDSSLNLNGEWEAWVERSLTGNPILIRIDHIGLKVTAYFVDRTIVACNSDQYLDKAFEGTVRGSSDTGYKITGTTWYCYDGSPNPSENGIRPASIELTTDESGDMLNGTMTAPGYENPITLSRVPTGTEETPPQNQPPVDEFPLNETTTDTTNAPFPSSNQSNLVGPSETSSNETAEDLSTTGEEGPSGPPTTTTGSVTEGNFSTYSNPSLGIEFLYPTLWINSTELVENLITFIQYTSPLPDNQSKFGGTLSISYENLSDPITLEEYVVFNDILLNSTLDSYNVIQSENSILAGSPSITRVFTMKNAFVDGNLTLTQVNLKGIQTYVIAGNKAYTILLLAEESNYDIFLPFFQTISNSFQLIDQIATVKPTSEITANGKQTNNPLYFYFEYPNSQLQMQSLDMSKPTFEQTSKANILKVTDRPPLENVIGGIAGALGTWRVWINYKDVNTWKSLDDLIDQEIKEWKPGSTPTKQQINRIKYLADSRIAKVGNFLEKIYKSPIGHAVALTGTAATGILCALACDDFFKFLKRQGIAAAECPPRFESPLETAIRCGVQFPEVESRVS